MCKGKIYMVDVVKPQMKMVHKLCTGVVNEDPDYFIDLLMDHLGIEVPSFNFKKHLKLKMENNIVTVSGIDEQLNDKDYVFESIYFGIGNEVSE